MTFQAAFAQRCCFGFAVPRQWAGIRLRGVTFRAERVPRLGFSLADLSAGPSAAPPLSGWLMTGRSVPRIVGLGSVAESFPQVGAANYRYLSKLSVCVPKCSWISD